MKIELKESSIWELVNSFVTLPKEEFTVTAAPEHGKFAYPHTKFLQILG